MKKNIIGMICPSCVTSNPVNSSFCQYCGSRLQAQAADSASSNAINTNSILTWEEVISLFKNPVVVKQTLYTVLFAGIFMALLISFIMAATGEFDGIIPMLKVSLMMTIGFGLLIALIMLLFFRGRVRMRFTLNEEGILVETLEKSTLGSNRMAIIAGVLGKSAQTVGAGILASSREKEFVAWDEFSEIVENQKHLLFELKSRTRTLMLLVCSPGNYFIVREHLFKMIIQNPERARKRQKKLAKPMVRALLRTLAISLAVFPVFSISEPLNHDVFLPILLYCFTLATVWLLPLFGWVVIVCTVILAFQFTISGINEFIYLYYYEQVLFILTCVGLIFLTWFSWGALRGRFKPPLLES